MKNVLRDQIASGSMFHGISEQIIMVSKQLYKVHFQWKITVLQKN